MPKKRYLVELAKEERAELKALTRKGRISVRKLKRAQVLLHADAGKTDVEIADLVQVGLATVARTRKRYVDSGLEAALSELPRSGRPPVLGPEQVAELEKLASSPPPAGHSRWTLRMLADELVARGTVDKICVEAVRLHLKRGHTDVADDDIYTIL